MSGLSATNLLVQPLRTPGGGAGVVESPIPASTVSDVRSRQEVKAIRRVAAVSGHREQPRPAAPQGREVDADGAESQRSRSKSSASQPAALGALRPPQGAAAFAAQVLGQDQDPDRDLAIDAGAYERLRASDAYRRSGGEPPLFPEAAAVFSLAV